MWFFHKCDNALTFNAKKQTFLTNDLTRNNCPNSINRLHCQDKYSKPVQVYIKSLHFFCVNTWCRYKLQRPQSNRNVTNSSSQK